MLCPSDSGLGNRFQGTSGNENWARGNYGYNAIQFWPSNLNWKKFHRVTTVPDPNKPSQPSLLPYNIGMGGFSNPQYHETLSLAKITDGTSKTIMLAEMRVGLSPRDRRGVWAMGMCGSNMHCRHAAFAPNDCNGFGDDIYKSAEITADVPRDTLLAECMGVDSTNNSGQSVVRSVHSGGVNCAMADGSVRFVSDFVDAGSALQYLGALIGEVDTDTSEQTLRTWQRLLISRDGLPVSGEF
jgi:prepilin-type processing-associated H-X9-DG protein